MANNKSLKTGLCNLCKQEKTLLSQFTLLPEFMYDGMYDEKHFLHKYEFLEGEVREIKQPLGEYEGGLLCYDCDTVKLQSLETYANNALYDKNGRMKPEQRPIFNSQFSSDGTELTIINNIDYTKFKLFLLSILWRAGISKRNQFNTVQLPPDISEELRLMILNNNAGDELRFPCVIASVNEGREELSGITSHFFTSANSRIYALIIKGVFYYYFLIHLT